MRLGIPLMVFSLCMLAGYAEVRSQTKSGPNGFALVDKSGNISKPADVRDTYQSLGAYTVLDPRGNQMHMTYASPGSAEAYRKTGKFPDGTVLVKEVFGTEHAQMTTGDAHWASGTKVWFVLIKDEKGRYKDNPLSGETDGDGRYLSPMRPISKWQRTTRRIARDGTFPRGRRIGSTSKVIQFSPQSDPVQETVSQN